MTKDQDFEEQVRRPGPPLLVIWVSLEYTSNQKLIEIQSTHFHKVKSLLKQGKPLVEIRHVAQ